RDFIAPARGHRLPGGDVVHHDLNLSNVLVSGGVITGIVDWDHAGTGCRATDLATLLFEWQRLRLVAETGLAPVAASGGGQRIAGAILRIAGQAGLRCVLSYVAIANLALSEVRSDYASVGIWARVTKRALDDAAMLPTT